jgi:hypothetical protein
MNRPKPFLPSDTSRARNRWLERSAVASVLSIAAGDAALGGPSGIAKKMWGDGAVVDLILRAAVVPSSTSTASQLAGSAVAAFVESLAPISAGARLIEAAPRVDLTGIASITVPARAGAIASDDVLWVVEGEPIPVARLNLTNAATLTPKKLAAQCVITRERAVYSTSESVIARMLRESAAVALDASLFSTAAATTARPAGILNGVAPLTATTGGGGRVLKLPFGRPKCAPPLGDGRLVDRV